MPSETEREARERREKRARTQYMNGTGYPSAYVEGAEYEAPIAREAERAAIVPVLSAPPSTPSNKGRHEPTSRNT